MIRLTAVIELDGQAPRALTHESNARSLVLGRDSSADFQLPLATISRRHARISETDNVYFIEDLGSTHGTSLNGRRLNPGEKRTLHDGDIIEMTRAKVTCAIAIEKVALAEPGEGTRSVAARAVQGILGRLGDAKNEGPFLRMISGPDEGVRFSLGGAASEWALGRSPDCEFVLRDPNVSRRHATVKKDWNGFALQDLGSKNGVFVNEKRLQKPHRLRDRDEITIGPIKLLYVDPDAELLAALKGVPGFDFEDLEAHAESDAVARDMSTSRPAGGPLVGAPFDGAAAVAGVSPVGMPSGEMTAAQPERQLPADQADRADQIDDELSGIDPSLLAGQKARGPLEWVAIGVVSFLIVAATLVLFLIVL